jgi:DNA-binding NarL/FixJ family response regulator
MQTRLLIVEDQPLFSDALASGILSAMPELDVCQVYSLTEARAATQREQGFNLVLLDLWLPDTHGFEGLIELRRLFPRVPIVVVSAFSDQSVVQKAIICGALGFIPKSASRDTFVHAIVRVLAGETVFPDCNVPTDPARVSELTARTRRLESLTHKQLRVLQMLCHGLLNKQIAFELHVHETSVKAHVTEVLRKLSVGTRTQAVIEVSKLNLADVLALYVGDDAKNASQSSRLCTDKLAAE